MKDSRGTEIRPAQRGVIHRKDGAWPLVIIGASPTRDHAPVLAVLDGSDGQAVWVEVEDLVVTHRPDGTLIGEAPSRPETLTEVVQAIAAHGPKPETAAERIRNAAQSVLHAIAGDAVRAYRDLAIVNGRLHKTQASLTSAKPDLMALLADLTNGHMDPGAQMAQAATALQALEDALGQIGEAIAIIENPMQTKEGE